MKAILIKDNKTMAEGEVPMPTLKAGEVLVKVHAAAVNRADLMQVEGCYPPPPGCPDWPGLEVSGTVAGLSPEAEAEGKWHIGDNVCALLGGGGYAEYVAAQSFMLMPVPKGMSLTEASALPEAFATAYLNLFIEGGATAGQTLLMHAGASGLASVIIPMAKAFGLRVITTVLSEEKADSIRHLGADVIVDTSKDDIADVLRMESESGHPVNIAIDCLGGARLGECFPYLAYGCRWIMIATLAGDTAEINMRTLYVKNIRLIGSTLRSKPEEFKGEVLSKLVSEVWPLVECGKVRPTVYKIMKLSDANDAHALLREGKSTGKVILTVE